ncbi:stage III sporulation protein AA [Clostridium tetanomorphum]|nr:stage III sporulation protein AA [Clostridium tetanomorphum]KAJ51488.1 stage III sporulation protein AA [Clostridium tetanomorphum DSM 665]MBP1863909.1 stage III sporulation protein AA [Clostridium tetanomorphum]NRS84987.1 stage III sporulation protein AA [Clostridium tetanomorphum]NRZ98203.1 stage III sporulation protein AA [Clostridium tetanomorphum]SQB91488.1 stage III sporulation protein AA [Clostridium tetanomorphum]
MINTKEVLHILPDNIKKCISLHNVNNLQEIRIRAESQIILQVGEKEIITNYVASLEDIKSILQRMSNYSIYAYDEEIRQGYITIKGGHRVGICGRCVLENNEIKTIREPASLNIRICKEVIGCSNKIMTYIIGKNTIQNTIIISPPKCGKTTLLRDIARNVSNGINDMNFKGRKVSVIDERSEIAACFNGVPQLKVGLRTDVLDSCPKSKGMMMAIRSMSPDVIICDEIGTVQDVDSMIMAMNSGVNLITTIHGYGIDDLYERSVFKEIINNKVFKIAVVLSNKEGVGTIEYIYNFNDEKVIIRR